MACCLKTGFYVSGSSDTLLGCRAKGSLGVSPSVEALQLSNSRSKDFMGKQLDYSVQNSTYWDVKAPTTFSVKARASISVSRALRWWEKTLKPNMIEIHSAQELVDSLLNAGDRLVIVDFYSPGCGGCKALHPKICQLAESNPNAIFLKVNYEELKPMCYSLHIHVLPFFRFYRGAEGRLCSFSCTNATIKKFKDALAKYGTEGCSLGPARGLEESELLALASSGQISRNVPLGYATEKKDKQVQDVVLNGFDLSSSVVKDENKRGVNGGSAVVMA
ncbi:unnamed protein product [Coffea canephora]|uniref:Thioredoxin domain-containing protein n=1 Tax=Coffea canephora TaxID=49390 RepID=A0A068UV56_COFCA|nr:unnamed protein product [Coffea canephora]